MIKFSAPIQLNVYRSTQFARIISTMLRHHFLDTYCYKFWYISIGNKIRDANSSVSLLSVLFFNMLQNMGNLKIAAA